MAKFLSGVRAAVAGLSAGCGSDPYRTVPVRGKVTCNRKPAAGGVVTFVPVDAPDRTGRPAGHPGVGAAGTVGADGTFTLTGIDGKPGALVGPHKVLFQPPPAKRPRLTGDDKASMSPEEIKEAEANRSLVPVLKDPAAGWRTAVLTECFTEKVGPRVPDWQAVRTDRWKYIRYPTLDGMDELYDLRADPGEVTNRVADPAGDTLKQLRGELKVLLDSTR